MDMTADTVGDASHVDGDPKALPNDWRPENPSARLL